MTRSGWSKKIVVAISLATLALVSVFRKTTFPTGDRYFEIQLPRLEIVSVLACVVLVSLLFVGIQFFGEKIAARRIRIEADIVFFVLGVMCFGALSGEFLTWLSPGTYDRIDFQLPLAVALVCALLPRTKMSFFERITENLRAVAIICFPFAAIVCVQAFIQLVNISDDSMGPSRVERYLSLASERKLARRVVWVVFDELDQSVIEQLPPNITLDQIERLKSESFVAANAFPPNNTTQKAIPSLLLGRQVSRAEPSSSTIGAFSASSATLTSPTTTATRSSLLKATAHSGSSASTSARRPSRARCRRITA